MRSIIGSAGRAIGRLGAVSRAGEWWEYKLVPIFAAFYASALHLGVPVWTLWPSALALLAALVPGAVFVSVINDLTDRDEDAIAGKANRMAGRPAWQAVLMVAAPVAMGLAFAWLWRDDPPLLLAYLAAWTAFSLYSLAPFRLKTRGFLGVIADASGAHLFPTLVAVLLVARQAGQEADPLWIGAVGLWAAAYGLRGILWHQLSDLDQDRAAQVRTFAQRHDSAAVVRLARYLIFPLEVVGLAAMLWLLGHPLPPLALLFYLVLVQRRVAVWQMRAVLVQPRPRYLILMADYYDVFLPLAVLIASAILHPLDVAVVAVHLLLFPNRARTVAEEGWRLRHSLLHFWSRPRRQSR